MEKNTKISVRKLVEFILRSGDIDSRYSPKDRMYEGAKAHRTLQKKNSEQYAEYESEVVLSTCLKKNDINYSIEGRADGIIHDQGVAIIDEIKTTTLPLDMIDEDFDIAHWGQAKCYAYIYADLHHLTEISVQLTYFNLDTCEAKQFIKVYTQQELHLFLMELIERYSKWADFATGWESLRNQSIGALPFPFPVYRKGQRELAVHTYRTIVAGRNLFVQAPTGTGKTISTLFPAVKAMGEGKTSKIFYLTAKTITRQVAEEAFDHMRQSDLKMKTLTLTAKEKICFCEKTVCRPEYCAYAKGHFDRVNDAVYEMINHVDHFTRGVIEQYAQDYQVCPYELSLDVSLWVDSIICDYNYVFDPTSYLRRFFSDGGGDYTFLIDEAHNLVDRSREMFSSTLFKKQFFQIKKEFKGKNKAFDKVLNGINKYFLELRHQCGEEGYFVTGELQEVLIERIHTYTAVCEKMLKENNELGENSDFLMLYFEVLNFTLIADLYDERYVTFVESSRGDVMIKLFCLDPSQLLRETLKRGSAAVLFSATLMPLEYFRDLLGGTETDKMIALDSPFDSDNLCLITADHISTTFKQREQSKEKISQLIGTFISGKTGNYIVYFPSYKYMHDVFAVFQKSYPETNTVEQATCMTEQAREQFLSCFEESPERTLVAFCVLGGIFSEGIDLKGSRLIGSVIVSVGLPQLNVQQNIIRDFFNKNNGMGFEYAYMYPGMNKVLQAAGRVIRSENDMGAILLIDERFGHNRYVRLYPKHWQNGRQIRDVETLKVMLDGFWTDHDT